MDGDNRLAEEYFLKDDLLQTKIVIFLCLFFVGLLIYGDYLHFGFGDGFFAVVMARAVFLVFSALMLLALRRVRTPRQHDWFVAAWAGVFILLAVFVNFTRPVASLDFTYVDILVVLALFLVFPCSSRFKGALAAVLTVSDLAIAAFLKSPVDDLTIKTVGLSYFLAFVLGLFIASRLQAFRRQHYDVHLREQDSRRQLERAGAGLQSSGALDMRRFFRLGAFEFDRYLSLGAPLSVIMLKANLFRSVVTDDCQAAGDRYLQELTALLVANKRGGDVLGRLSGGEFGLLLPDTDGEAAGAMAARLRRRSSGRRLSLDGRQLPAVLTIATATAAGEDRIFPDVLRRANEALYDVGNSREKPRKKEA